MYGFVRDPETNDIFGWAQDGFVFDIETRRRKIFALRGSDLYSLSGEFLNLHLENTDGSGLRMGGGGNRPEALATFRKLLDAGGRRITINMAPAGATRFAQFAERQFKARFPGIDFEAASA